MAEPGSAELSGDAGLSGVASGASGEGRMLSVGAGAGVAVIAVGAGEGVAVWPLQAQAESAASSTAVRVRNNIVLNSLFKGFRLLRALLCAAVRGAIPGNGKLFLRCAFAPALQKEGASCIIKKLK